MVRTSEGGGGSAPVLAMTDAVVTQACGQFLAQSDPAITPFTASWGAAPMLTDGWTSSYRFPHGGMP